MKASNHFVTHISILLAHQIYSLPIVFAFIPLMCGHAVTTPSLCILYQITFCPIVCVLWEIIATFSSQYQVFTSTNSWVGIIPVSKGRPTFPHLFRYFCDICLGILGNALSLVCPVIRECGSGVFFLPFPLARPPLLNCVLPQRCVLLSLPLTVFCLRSVWTMAALLLLVPAQNARNPSRSPEEASDPTDCT